MLHQVESFLHYRIPDPMKYWVKAMVVRVDAVNQFGETFGGVIYSVKQMWMIGYWALKPSAEKFWTLLKNRYDNFHPQRLLSRHIVQDC